MKKNFLVLFLAVIMLNFQSVFATRIYVSTTGSGDGSSWARSMPDLSKALDMARSGDTIWVAAGIYYPTLPIDKTGGSRDVAFMMKEDVHVFGGFSGSESELSDRATDSSTIHSRFETVLSGDIGNRNDFSDNSYHVVVSYKINSFTLDGFTVRDGFGEEERPLEIGKDELQRNVGAGIYNFESNGIFKHLVVRDNLTASSNDELGGGAGMYNWNINDTKGIISIDSSIFYSNTAKSCNGGAMNNTNSSIVITNSYFTSNICHTTDEGGGAIDNREGSDCIITNVVFDSNESSNSGGGIYNDGSSPILTDVWFENNIAGSCGGGMDTDGGSNAILNNVTFYKNQAKEDGGGLYGWKSSPTLNNVKFFFNRADQNGGGMYYYNTCKPWVTNSVFAYNDAGISYGGFGLERESEAVLTNVLIVRNTAYKEGGGLGSEGASTKIILTNGTVSKNTATNGNGGGGYDMGTLTEVRNSIFTDNYPNDLEINPLLVLNARNTIVDDNYLEDGSVNPSGTPVSSTIFADPDNNDFTLIATSPAFDLGDSTFFLSTSTPDISAVKVDIDGNPRILGNNIDLGCYESCPSISVPLISLSRTPATKVQNGVTVKFSLSMTNIGNNPEIKWFKNSIQIPSLDGDTYDAVAGTDFSAGDTIWAEIHATEACIEPSFVISNKHIMDVCASTFTPEVTITVSDTGLLAPGTQVEFNASVTNAGVGYTIEWYKNSARIAMVTTTTYRATAGTNFQDGDEIWAKVVSSDPCANPSDASSNRIEMEVCTNVLTPTANVTISTGGLVPSGRSVTFSLTYADAGDNTSIEWYNNSSLIVGENSDEYVGIAGNDFNAGDTIWAKVISSDPCVVPGFAWSNPVVMDVCAQVYSPKVIISSDLGEIVQNGKTVTFTALYSDAGNNPEIEWYNNGIAIANQNGMFYTAVAGVDFVDGDTISAKVISDEPCAVPNNGVSNRVIMQICSEALVPAISISVNPKGVAPINTEITFTADVTNAGNDFEIKWFKNGNQISGANNATYSGIIGSNFFEGDEIYATVKSNDPCAEPDNGESNKIAVEVCQQTLNPKALLTLDNEEGVFEDIAVTFTLDITSAGDNPEIEWYNNSNVIDGQTGLTYSAIAGTDYQNGDTIWAKVISNDPCAVPNFASSNKKVMRVFGLGVNSIVNNMNINLSPNPNTGSFVVNADFELNQNYNLVITDITGKIVMNENFKAQSSNKEINLQNVSSGVYFLTVSNLEKGSKTIKFIVE